MLNFKEFKLAATLILRDRTTKPVVVTFFVPEHQVAEFLAEHPEAEAV